MHDDHFAGRPFGLEQVEDGGEGAGVDGQQAVLAVPSRDPEQPETGHGALDCQGQQHEPQAGQHGRRRLAVP
ncbi:hypothetical protein D3C85_1458350 [compost metagenome]